MFGVLPLIRDAQVIVEAQSRISKRLKILEDLRDGDGVRRRLLLEEEQLKGATSDIFLDSETGLLIPGKVTRSAYRKIWATVRWQPDRNFRVPDTDRRRWMEARRAVLGLNVDLVTAWNLMPWSWLIDYFGGVGDMLNATRNNVGASPGVVCIMARTNYVANISAMPPSGLTGGGAFDMAETLERFPSSGFTGLTASLPVLTSGQVSILGALAISRLPKR
jgi:hypothetical protein